MDNGARGVSRGRRAAAAAPTFVSGSILRHILVMTGTGAVGLMAIFIGMAVLMPVLLVGHLLSGRRADETTTPANGESGGV